MSRARLQSILEHDPDYLLTPGEFARAMRVDAKTVTRWVASGKFLRGETLKTPGGHARIKAHALKRLLDGEEPRVAQPGDSEGALRKQE